MTGKADNSLGELIRTLLYVPVILIFWQCTWYTTKRGDLPVSGVQRVCYEIIGPAAEIRLAPPDLVMSFCTSVLPAEFKDKEQAVQQSSVMGVYRVVMHIARAYHSDGFVDMLWAAFSQQAVARLLECSNWVKLVPSILMFSPNTRTAVLGLYIASALGAKPVPLANFTFWFHLLGLMCFVEWLTRDGVKILNRIIGGQRGVRQLQLRWLLTDLSITMLLPLVLSYLVVFLMVGVAILTGEMS